MQKQKWSLNVIADNCERALADTKSGSKERSILSLAAKTVKKAMKDGEASRKLVPNVGVVKQSTDSTILNSNVPPDEPSSAAAKPTANVETRSSCSGGPHNTTLTAGVSQAPSPSLASSPVLPASSLRSTDPQPTNRIAIAQMNTADQLATSEDELNCLAYAASIALIGENGSRSGAVARGSSKALASSLELIALLLDTPLIPTAFTHSLPVFEFAKSGSHGGAQVFFSKLLGASSQGPATLSASNNNNNRAADAGSIQQVRLLLVDAVLSASEVVRSREATDRLWFVYLAALSAAAVPQCSRARACDITSDLMRADYLCLHGDRLSRVLEFLFTTLSLTETTPVLTETARNVLHRIAKALSSYVECHGSRLDGETKAVDGPLQVHTPRVDQEADSSTSCRECDSAVSADGRHGRTYSDIPSLAAKGIEDMRRAMRLCASVLTSTFVASTGGGPGLASGNSTSGGTSTVATAPTGDSAPVGVHASPSYVAVTTALGTLLSFVVNGGPTFRKSNAVAQVIRQSVLPAAMRMSLSPDVDLFRLSLNVILYSCFRFSRFLVSETGTVFRHVYFRVLSSKFASLAQKLLVLDVFEKYIEEPQNLIGLFLNYDCNTYSQSVYEEMIHYLAALAFPWPTRQVTSSTNPVIKELCASLSVKLEFDVDDSLRQRAMAQLVMVADSNIQWIERFEDDSASVGAASGVTHFAEAQTDLLGSDATARTVATMASDESHDVGTGAAANSQDTFLQARRYKDAFKKFLYMFNDQGSPEAAIDFLRSSVLFEECEPASAAAVEVNPTPTAPTDAEDTWRGENTDSDVMTTHADEQCNRTDCATGDLAQPAHRVLAAEESGPADASRTTPAVAVPEAPVDTAAAPTPLSVDNGSFDDAPAENAAVADAHKVAVFLHRNEDYLDKLALGDYFAKSFRKPTTRHVFEEWIKLHNFSEMTLDEALRLFLGGFKLLGEAQVVDKTMELFAAQYCRQNPTVFRAADTAFILSFSICMLNTDAHSAHIKEKMSLDGFIKNNAGIDDGMDVSRDILTGIYQRITRDEIVLRPSPHCPSFNAKTHSAGGDRSTSGGQKKMTANVLRSVPILRKLIPLASAITDKVALPIDMFNSAERKREELYQAELASALEDIMTVISSSDPNRAENLNKVHLVMASRIEHAIPMWEVTVSPICNLLIASLVRFVEDAEAYKPLTPSANVSAAAGATGNGGSDHRVSGDAAAATGGDHAPSHKAQTSASSAGIPPLVLGSATATLPSCGAANGAFENLDPYCRASYFLSDDPNRRHFMDVLLHGLDSVIKVCCAFGNVMHTEMVVEHCFELTQLSQTIVCAGQPAPHVTVTQTLSAPRLAVTATLLNLFVSHGTSLTAPSWQFCYSVLSLVDACANGIDGVFHRKSKKLLLSSSPNPATDGTGGKEDGSAQAPRPPPRSSTPAPDMWFGDIADTPDSIGRTSIANRQRLLNGIRQARGSAVDLWLEKLFDATLYPFATQVHMANGLAPVAAKELQTERVFSLTKLFDFVSSCAMLSSRLQWRELWSHARAVFVMAGRMKDTIARSTLDGLRLIALTYLMREELFNYSFQKEVLKPFEDVLMSNQSVAVRTRIIQIISELVEFRASRLASGWSVVFSCLSHAAVIPEIVVCAWDTCEKIITTQLVQVKDYFSEFVFCLTTFACTTMEESIALKGISYLAACGHWLVYGLDTPPANVRDAAEVVTWACRYGSVDAEVRASHANGRHLTRITLATEHITAETPLKKPATYATKTAYQVWMSLFEGLVPVVVIQSSVRVRVHAINCIWTLVKMYGCALDAAVQDSLFSGMLRPMLTTVTSHIAAAAAATDTPAPTSSTVATSPSLPPSAESTAAGAHQAEHIDYMILISVSFRGMLSACVEHPHLLELACATLVHFSGSTPLTRPRLLSGIVSPLLGAAIDFLSAGCTTEAQDFFWRSAHHGEEACPSAGEPLHATSPAGLAGEEWMASCSSLALGMMRDALLTGRVDAVQLKRTSGWLELHNSPVTRRDVSFLSGLCLELGESQRSVVQRQLRQTAVNAVTALYTQLMERLRIDRTSREMCLVACRDARRCLLVASAFTVITRDPDGFWLVLETAMTPPALLTSPPTVATTVPVFAIVPDTHTAGNSYSSSQAHEADSHDESRLLGVPALESLLLRPYTVVMIEFIVECAYAQQLVCDSKGFNVSTGSSHCISLADLNLQKENLSARLATDLTDSRRWCLDAQAQIRTLAAAEAAGAGNGAVKGKPFKAYKGQSFTDTFRAARAPMSERVRYFDYETASPELLQRIFNEWRYLLDVLALHFCLERLLSSSATVDTTTPLDVSGAVELLPHLPSELEECAAEPFLRSCWDELGTHTQWSPVSTVGMVVQAVQRRLHTAAPLTVYPSCAATSSSGRHRTPDGCARRAPAPTLSMDLPEISREATEAAAPQVICAERHTLNSTTAVGDAQVEPQSAQSQPERASLPPSSQVQNDYESRDGALGDL